MSNIKIKDADGSEKYVKSLGAGTNDDPFVTVNELQSVVSTDNSTTTLLTNGSTFTGTGELNDHPDVMITVKTDQSGVLYFDFSPDGTNCDATVVRPTDYKSEVAMGKRQGRTSWNKFGYNLDVDSGTEEILASWGGAFDPTSDIISTAQTFTIAYNNATDGLGTTGALSLSFSYIDENFLAQTATHTLSNTGSDVTSFTGLGINRVKVLSSGSAGYNTNDITITATTDATTQALIPALGSVTQQAIFHTQVNHKFLSEWLVLNARKLSGGGGSPRITFKGYRWDRSAQTRYEVFREDIDTSVENTIKLSSDLLLVIEEKNVLYFTATTDTNNTAVNCRFSGIEERIN